MFGKLLKYELKSVGKWYLTLNAAVLLVSIILGLVLKALSGNFSTDTNSTSAQIFTIILVLLLAMVISGSLLSTLAIIIKRFYSNIFGRQGYLTLTLPVTTNQIICSKLLASLLWSIFNIFIVIIGIILVILPLVGIGQFVVAFPEIYKIISSSNAPLFIAYFFLSYVAGTLLIYLSIAVGQLFTNKRVLMGIVSYFGISLLITFLTLIIDSIFHIDLFNSHANATFSQPVLLYNILVSIVEIAIFYMLTHSIIKYKLNIQ
ncbi:TPA: ABC transporter (permease) [Streptococcus agalactiae]|nr:ABC transporter (permease) [Streptococcus agalactiae]HEO0292579.1 ABC transporter (permease) [Streptococcus agalactiae]